MCKLNREEGRIREWSGEGEREGRRGGEAEERKDSGQVHRMGSTGLEMK